MNALANPVDEKTIDVCNHDSSEPLSIERFEVEVLRDGVVVDSFTHEVINKGGITC